MNTEGRLRRLERLERAELEPQRFAAALWATQESGELPEDPTLAAEVGRWLEALDAIEEVQKGISEDCHEYEANSSGDDVLDCD